MRLLLLLFSCLVTIQVFSQADPEFPKGTVLYISAQQGINTSFDPGPDHYIGGMGLSGQFTIIPQHLRLGAGGEFVFTNKNFSGLIGPRLAWKIKTMKMEPLGSVLNLQLQAEHLWGTDQQRLIGGLFGIELAKMFSFQLMAHRDYQNDAWWFRAGVGYNLLRKKRKSPTGTDPFEGL